MKYKCPQTGKADCGLCVSNMRSRGNYRGHAGYRGPKKKGKGSDVPVERPKAGSGIVGGAFSAPVGTFLSDCPLLCGYIADVAYSDGGPRKTSTITLFAEGGCLKACLSDRDLGRTAWVTAAAVEEILYAFEQGLATDSLDWRTAQGAKARK